MQLNGLTVLITQGGGESGRLMTERFLSEGARVAVHMDDRAAAPDPRVLHFAGDPADQAHTRDVVDETVARFGHLDLLVVGIAEATPMTLEGATDAQMQRALTVNARSAFFFTQAAARHMRRQRVGKIIYAGSIHSEKPVGSAVGFSMAMGAVQMLCHEVTLDLSAYNVQSIYLQAGAMEGDDIRFAGDVAALYDHFEDKIPGGKPVTQGELLDLLVFLATPACTMFNGAVLRADHGFMMHYMPRSSYEEQGVPTDD